LVDCFSSPGAAAAPAQRESGTPPIGQGGTVERDTLACIDLRLAIERRVVGILATILRDKCSVGMPLSISRPAPALHHLPAQAWQAYLGRRVTIT